MSQSAKVRTILPKKVRFARAEQLMVSKRPLGPPLAAPLQLRDQRKRVFCKNYRPLYSSQCYRLRAIIHVGAGQLVGMH